MDRCTAASRVPASSTSHHNELLQLYGWQRMAIITEDDQQYEQVVRIT